MRFCALVPLVDKQYDQRIGCSSTCRLGRRAGTIPRDETGAT